MKQFILLIVVLITAHTAGAQSPCGADPLHRQFDFWIGAWDVYGVKNKKAGDSKIALILHSCIVLEEWTSAGQSKGITYSGKSFNTYNAQLHQWQQTWVDNVGGTTAYIKGKLENNAMVFQTAPFPLSKDTLAIRKLSFFNLGPDKVRQLGEISKDDGKTWLIEFDLEYRRKK